MLKTHQPTEPDPTDIEGVVRVLKTMRTAMARNVSRARNGFLVLLCFALVAATLIWHGQAQLCRESHRRYNTIYTIIITSTAVSPVAVKRLPPDQLAQLRAYDTDFRKRLLASLGPSPTC